MEKGLFIGKSKRTKIFTVVTVSLIILIMALNLLLCYFGVQKTIFFDMTPEGLYTLSDTMEEECDVIFDELEKKGGDKKVRVTFCTDPDYLMASSKARTTYFMALKLQNRYPDLFEVKTVNAYINPTAVAQYKTTSLSKIRSDNVIISYGDRYRISAFDYYWSSGTSGANFYDGEYKIARLIKSVTSIARPVAYFLTGHGETVYDPENPNSEMSKSMSAFAELLIGGGLEIRLLDLSKLEDKRIPDDCSLLIINNPQTDFTYDESKLNSFGYVSDTEMLDRYLVMKQGAIIVAKDYRKTLPVFENFLYEWGFEFSDSILVDTESSLEDAENTGTQIIASYNTDPDSFAYTLYGEYADLSSAPLTVFSNSGSVGCSFKDSSASNEPGTPYASKNYVSFLTTSKTAQRYVWGENGEKYVDGAAGRYDLAALSIRSEINNIDNTYKYSYIFCVNSPDFLKNDLMGVDSFANYDIMSAAIDHISRVDESVSMNLGGGALNSDSFGGKMVLPVTMSEVDEEIHSNKRIDGVFPVIKVNNGISTTEKIIYSCLIAAVPVAVAIVGVVICLKRRYL